jgi:hypothetical protein
MRTNMKRSLVLAAFAGAFVMMAGCPAGKGLGGVGGGDIPKGVPKNPLDCELGTSDVGRKLQAFIDAVKNLEKTAKETAAVVHTSCKMMGEELGMAPGELEGETKDVCARVITAVKDGLKVSLKPKYKLNIVAKPAVCRVDIQATAKAAAECEAKAEADIAVKCEGKCTGTCNGTCNGKCSGAAGTGGSGGSCGGQCEGTCEGGCTGGCDGHADVNASAECKAHAEAKASIDVDCDPPEFKIDVDAKFVVDKSKLEKTLAALRKGIPEILSVKARLRPLQAAVKTTGKTALALKDSIGNLKNEFKDQAICVANKVNAAIDAMTNVSVSVEVSVEVSASASGSVGM